MPSFVVSTAFKTKDEMSKTFRRMGLSGNSFANKMISNFGRIDRKVLSTRKIIGGILGAAAIRRGIGMLGQGVRSVAEEFLDFEDSITAASAKFGIFDRKDPAFKALGDTAREVGATTEFTAAQAAGGLRFLAKAGWDANSSMKALPGLVNLATAAEVDLARASDIATDVMGAFGLKGKDAAQNMLELTRVSDVMSTAANSANVDMEELFETIKFAGPIAKTAGVSLEDFTTMAAFVGGAGIKGSMGGTALRTMFLNLAAPTDTMTGKLAEFNTEITNVKQLKNNRKDLAKLGIVIDDVGKLAPIETLKVLNERMKKLSPTARTAALQILFGKRAVSAAAVATEGAGGAMLEFQEKIKNAGGESKKVAGFMRDSLSKRLDALKSSAIDVGFQVIDTFKEKFPGGLEAATKAIREFDIKPIVKDVREAIGVAKDFLQVLKDYKGVLIGVAAGFTALKIGGFVASMWGLVGVAKALAAAGGLSGMFAGLAVLAGPVAVVALAVGGLAAGIYTLVTYWDDLGRAIGWVYDDFVEWLKLGPELSLNPLDWLMTLPRLIVSNWSHITGFFEEMGLVIRGVFDWLGSGVVSVIEGIVGTIKELFTKPKEAWDTFVEGIKTGIDKIFGWLKKLKNMSNPGALLGKAAKWLGFGGSEANGGKASPAASPAALASPLQDKSLKTGDKDQSAAPQAIKFEGRLDIAGATDGSKVSSKTRGAPPIRTELLGQN